MMMQITAHLINVSGGVPMATDIKCGWAHQLIPGLNDITGQIMGVALSLGQFLFLITMALLIVLFATKHGSTLVKVLLGVVAFGLLLNSGWLPVASPC